MRVLKIELNVSGASAMFHTNWFNEKKQSRVIGVSLGRRAAGRRRDGGDTRGLR